MTKAHVTAAFLLGGSLIGGNALAAEPLVEIIHAGASVGTYANFDAGMKAAAPGDVEVHATNVVFKTCGFAADSIFAERCALAWRRHSPGREPS